MANSTDWREALHDMLINAGTTGIKQRDLTHRLEHLVTADDIRAELLALLAQKKVQRFSLETKGRPATIWRATTLILEQDQPSPAEDGPSP